MLIVNYKIKNSVVKFLFLLTYGEKVQDKRAWCKLITIWVILQVFSFCLGLSLTDKH